MHAAVAGHVLIGGQCRGPGDVGLHPGGRRDASDDFLHGLDGLVGQGFALVAGEVDLGVGRLAVVALRACPGERVAPHVLNVFDVFGVGIELGDDPVVEGVRVGAQGLLTLQQDHDRAVGLVLVEQRAHALGCDHR